MVEYDYDTLPVKHIRHLIDISQDGLRQLVHEQRVAVHWGDLRSRDPQDYHDRISDADDAASATDDIEEINDIDKNGAIVVADYSSDYGNRKGIHKNKLFLGVIPPDTFEYREYLKPSGKSGGYKTLQFDDATYQEIHLTDRPDIFSDVPARRTINNCRKTKNRLRTLVDPSKSVARKSPEFLDHDQFEHVCVQYLSLIRFPGEFYMVTPVGGEDGNFPLIDINGGVSETPVVAQVTTAAGKGDVEGKLQDLVETFSDETHVFFFGPQKYAPEFNSRYEAVEYIGDQDVFDELESDPRTNPMLDRVLQR